MKRQLSSKQTFLLKIILPVFLAFCFTATILVLFLPSRGNAVLPPVILISVIVLIAFIGIFTWYFTLRRYKKVAVDNEFLYVSNYHKEIMIPVSNISDVTEVKWYRTRPITINLNADSAFGQKIVFMPKLNGFRIFAANPIVAELKKLAMICGEVKEKKGLISDRKKENEL